MDLDKKILELIEKSGQDPYIVLDRLFVPYDRDEVRRTRNIRRIPHTADRIGGKKAYAEWAHVIGIFQTLIYQNLKEKESNQILDVGCGKGLLAIASEPFIDEYHGLDVGKKEIAFCIEHFTDKKFKFHHLDARNPSYAPKQTTERVAWHFENNQFDLVTALSVWTHFSEFDARFYLNEVARVLKPSARALITMFILDDHYTQSLSTRKIAESGRYHSTNQEDWVFDQPSYGSENWFHPAWAKVPENAIAITEAGLKSICQESGLSIVDHMTGNWKEYPGVFFQDVLVLEKKG